MVDGHAVALLGSPRNQAGAARFFVGDSTFAVPGATGCGPNGDGSLDAMVNAVVGLPSPSGANHLVLDDASSALAVATDGENGQQFANDWHIAFDATTHDDQHHDGLAQRRLRRVVARSRRAGAHARTGVAAMMDRADRIVFPEVEVLDTSGLVLRYRIDGKIVGIPRLRLLPGTTIARTGDHGKLVLGREMASELGLVE